MYGRFLRGNGARRIFDSSTDDSEDGQDHGGDSFDSFRTALDTSVDAFEFLIDVFKLSLIHI